MVAGAVRGGMTSASVPSCPASGLNVVSATIESPLRTMPDAARSREESPTYMTRQPSRSGIMAGPERISRERVMATNLAVDLKALIAGQVLDDPAARAERDSDFGRMIHRVPGVVVRPASTQDVAAVIRYARKNAVPVATRGEAHTQSGQATVADGILIDLTSLDRILAIDPPGLSAECQA